MMLRVRSKVEIPEADSSDLKRISKIRSIKSLKIKILGPLAVTLYVNSLGVLNNKVLKSNHIIIF